MVSCSLPYLEPNTSTIESEEMAILPVLSCKLAAFGSVCSSPFATLETRAH